MSGFSVNPAVPVRAKRHALQFCCGDLSPVAYFGNPFIMKIAVRNHEAANHNLDNQSEVAMQSIKARLFGLLICLVSAGLTWYNWQDLLKHQSFSLKIATFGPVGIIGGFFLMLFPAYSGVPQSTKDRVLVFAVFGLGLVAGLLNLYLMDPRMFAAGSR
jgi:hypothetical protein